MELLKSVKLEDRVNHFPQQLSGGEEQRVAIARALANDPTIILADEPTGNLDKKNEKIIFEKLKEISKSGKCVIVVSHSENIKKYADEIYYIENTWKNHIKYTYQLLVKEKVTNQIMGYQSNENIEEIEQEVFTTITKIIK